MSQAEPVAYSSSDCDDVLQCATELYPDYKANRAAMPDDLVPQIPPIKEMVRAFNIPALELAGFEADDIIGTIARECEGRGIGVVVVTHGQLATELVNAAETIVGDLGERDFTLGEASLRLERAHQIVNAGTIRNSRRIQGRLKNIIGFRSGLFIHF